MKTINNNIQETYVSLEVAKLLKEKGFHVPVIRYHSTVDGKYDEEDKKKGYTGSDIPATDWNKTIENSIKEVELYSAPTQSLAIEWLRVNFGIWIKIDHFLTTEDAVDWDFEIDTETTDIDENGHYTALRSYDVNCGYKTPQEATEQSLLYVLTNLI